MAEKRERFSEVLRFRVTPEEKKLIFAWAEEDGRTVSSFVRIASLERVQNMRLKGGMGELMDFIRKEAGKEATGDVEPPLYPDGFLVGDSDG